MFFINYGFHYSFLFSLLLAQVKVRLTGGNDGTWGLLGIQRYGLWGQVCTDNLGDHEATVACRMLGYGGGRALGHAANMSLIASGPVWIKTLKCNGTEESLENCDIGTWGYPQTCQYNPSVVCYYSGENCHVF